MSDNSDNGLMKVHAASTQKREPRKPIETTSAKRKPGPSDRRRMPRKWVLLSGVVAALDGREASFCTVLDMNALGVQISLSRELVPGTQVIFLDTSNQRAHVSNVAWSAGDRAGLSFSRSYRIGPGLPVRLNFLWKLVLEAKLRELNRVVAAQTPVGLAITTVGLTEQFLHQVERYAISDHQIDWLLLYARRLIAK